MFERRLFPIAPAYQHFAAFMKKSQGDGTNASVVPEHVVSRLLEQNYPVVLTDDYAPVDNLIAPVFELRFGDNRRKQSAERPSEEGLWFLFLSWSCLVMRVPGRCSAEFNGLDHAALQPVLGSDDLQFALM